MRRIWKPWTIEIVGFQSETTTQLTFYRFWRAKSAAEAAHRLTGSTPINELTTTFYRAAKVEK